MTELERIEALEKQLKTRKRKALAKEYERLGRKFYKQSHAKNMTTAENMLEHIPMFQPKEPTLAAEQFKQLQASAENMQGKGIVRKRGKLSEGGEWVRQFGEENTSR